MGKGGSPTAAIIDSKTVKSARKRRSRSTRSAYDAGKKTKGVKYHILVDTLGLLVMVIVHAANIQDRDGAALVLDKRTRAMFPFITKVFADGGYQGERVAALLRDTGTWTLDIVKRSDAGKGFHVLPKRWIVERTLAWIPAAVVSPATSKTWPEPPSP